MGTIDWNALKDQAYENATRHGFHDQKESMPHDLCMVITELGEAINAHRSGIRADKEEFFEKYVYDRPDDWQVRHWRDGFERHIKDTFEDELADAIIRLLDLCGYDLIDLDGDEMDFLVESEMLITRVFNKKTLPERIFSIIVQLTGVEMIEPYTKTIPRAIAQLYVLGRDYGVDVKTHLELKMKYNEMRPRLNGKKY